LPTAGPGTAAMLLKDVTQTLPTRSAMVCIIIHRILVWIWHGPRHVWILF